LAAASAAGPRRPPRSMTISVLRSSACGGGSVSTRAALRGQENPEAKLATTTASSKQQAQDAVLVPRPGLRPAARLALRPTQLHEPTGQRPADHSCQRLRGPWRIRPGVADRLGARGPPSGARRGAAAGWASSIRRAYHQKKFAGDRRFPAVQRPHRGWPEVRHRWDPESTQPGANPPRWPGRSSRL